MGRFQIINIMKNNKKDAKGNVKLKKSLQFSYLKSLLNITWFGGKVKVP